MSKKLIISGLGGGLGKYILFFILMEIVFHFSYIFSSDTFFIVLPMNRMLALFWDHLVHYHCHLFLKLSKKSILKVVSLMRIRNSKQMKNNDMQRVV